MSAKESGSFAPLSSHARIAQRLLGARRYAKGRLQSSFQVEGYGRNPLCMPTSSPLFFFVWRQNGKKATIGQQLLRHGHINTWPLLYHSCQVADA
jgi:hypothetical protein